MVKKMVIVLLELLGISVLLALGTNFHLAAPGYEGPVSDHFDGERFYYTDDPIGMRKGALKWVWEREPEEWPAWVEITPDKFPVRRVEGERVKVTFINHSTVLLQTQGKNILTDPVWAERASPFNFTGPERVHTPGIAIEDLPSIDVILISHNHYDHMDKDAIAFLQKRDEPLVLAGLGTDVLMEKLGLAKSVDLDWWQSHSLGDQLTFHFVPVRHSTNRGLSDRDTTLWGGFVIETAKGPIYFGGDSGWGKHFEKTYKKFGPMRFSLLPIGAYAPTWFMYTVHITPEQAVKAHKVLKSEQSMGIHWGTFQLTDEGYWDPVNQLATALRTHGLNKEEFVALEAGKHLWLK